MKFLSLFLLCCCLFFTGCPYQGTYPIGKKTGKPVEKEILGKWKANAWDQQQFIEIMESGDSAYFIKLTTVNYDDTEHTIHFYQAWPAKFKGDNVFNFQKANSKGEPVAESYYYFKIKFEKGVLSTTNLVHASLAGEEQSFADAEEWEKYLKKNWDEDGFWGEEIVWERI